MAELPRIDRDVLRQHLLAKFDLLVDQVADAVDNAPVGRIVDDSEEIVRDAADRFRTELFQEALQQKVNAAQAAFSPSGPIRKTSPS